MQHSQQDMQTLEKLKDVIDDLYERHGYTGEVEDLQRVFDQIKTKILKGYTDAFEEAKEKFPDLMGHPEIVAAFGAIQQVVNEHNSREDS